MKVLQKLVSNDLLIIDVDNITSLPELPRVKRHFYAFDSIGVNDGCAQ